MSYTESRKLNLPTRDAGTATIIVEKYAGSGFSKDHTWVRATTTSGFVLSPDELRSLIEALQEKLRRVQPDRDAGPGVYAQPVAAPVAVEGRRSAFA